MNFMSNQFVYSFNKVYYTQSAIIKFSIYKFALDSSNI